MTQYGLIIQNTIMILLRAKTRRDSRHRILRRGESIRADGNYQFKYHINGKPHFVYSWRWNRQIPSRSGKSPTYCCGSWRSSALGEKVREVIQQYADGSLSAEQERDLRQTWFKFNIHIK